LLELQLQKKTGMIWVLSTHCNGGEWRLIRLPFKQMNRIYAHCYRYNGTNVTSSVENFRTKTMKWSQPWDDRIGRHPFPAEPVGWQQPQCPSWPTLKLSTSGCLVYLQTRMKVDSTGKKRLAAKVHDCKGFVNEVVTLASTLGSSKNYCSFQHLLEFQKKKKRPSKAFKCIATILEVGLYRPRNSCHSLEWPASASDEMEILTICRTTWQGVSWKPCKNWSLHVMVCCSIT